MSIRKRQWRTRKGEFKQGVGVRWVSQRDGAMNVAKARNRRQRRGPCSCGAR